MTDCSPISRDKDEVHIGFSAGDAFAACHQLVRARHIPFKMTLGFCDMFLTKKTLGGFGRRCSSVIVLRDDVLL